MLSITKNGGRYVMPSDVDDAGEPSLTMPPAILRFDPRLQRPSSAREGVKKQSASVMS